MAQQILKLRSRTPAQKRISESKARFNIARWGRQSGKTTFGVDKMTYRPLMGRRNGKYWFVLQTFNAASIAFERQARLLHGSGLMRRKPRESDLTIFLENGADVYYKSGDKPQALRSETLDGAILDECRLQQKETWTQILYPMLGRYNGWCDFYSTPNGFDWFYDLEQMAVKKNPLNEWAAFHAPSTECWWWTPAQIEQARAQMTDGEFRQEILAEYLDLYQGSAYGSFGNWNIADGLKPSPYLPIELYMDFNVKPLSWVYGQFRNGIGHEFFGEIYAQSRSDTAEGIREFISRMDWSIIRAEPQVILIGDASGRSAKTSASGETDYTIIEQALRDAKISFENKTPLANPLVKDRVNTVNARLRAADGTTQIQFDRLGCPETIEDMRRTAWKIGLTAVLDPGPDRMRTHLSDAVGYGVCVRNPIKKLTDPSYFRIVTR